MAILVVNPGTGPVVAATEENAKVNVRQFAKDLAEKGVKILRTTRRSKDDYGEGRFCFHLRVAYRRMKRTLEVQMPGLPLEKVRYLGTPEQNIWHYPRLYIDGSSWVWSFAVDVSIPEKDDM